MQTLLFDAAETRKRWLGDWSVMVQGVTDGLDLVSTKLRHWACSLQEAASDTKLSERKEIPLKCKKWSGGAALARAKQKHVPAVGHGEECTSKSSLTHLWNSYGKVLQGVGRAQQQAVGMDG
jgi:hypothetical protein